MVKIKTKKEMMLPELIEWALEKGMTYRTYFGSKGGEIYFDGFGIFKAEIDVDVYPKETFEVEFEEEITEEMKIPTLIGLFVCDYGQCDYGQIMHMYHNESINDAIGDVDEDARSMSKAFYMLNDDMTMTLIWKDEEMVE